MSTPTKPVSRPTTRSVLRRSCGSATKATLIVMSGVVALKIDASADGTCCSA